MVKYVFITLVVMVFFRNGSRNVSGALVGSVRRVLAGRTVVHVISV